MTLGAAFVIRFILAALAVYRVAMFTREDGPFNVFANVRAYLGRQVREIEGGAVHNVNWTLAEISNCPHCIGVWLALLFAPAVIWPSFVTDVILLFLAIAGLQSYLTGREE
jgi:hypothetical protein